MDVVVDLRTGTISLADADDLRHFAVRTLVPPGGAVSAGDLGALTAALASRHVGTVDPDGSALIDPSAIRQLARSSVPSSVEWEADFASMLDTAATGGWVAADGSIRAHVTWDGAS